MTSSNATVTVTGLRKRFGPPSPSTASTSPSGRRHRAPRPERRRQDHDAAHPGHRPARRRRPGRGPRRRSVHRRRPLAVRRRLGYLPQEPGFHRHFSAFEFVDYVAILKEWVDRKPRHDEVRRVLTLVGLDAVMHKRIGQLSGGMRRRVGIAQALLGRPDLLVLDEPTAGLDPEQRLRFRELLGTEAAGATVLLSTHQTDDVAALCQHVVVLLAGRIRFNGTPAELAALAAGRVWLAGERDPRADLAWVTGEGRVRHIGVPPTGAQLVEPTVEDGYLILAGRDAHADGEALAS